MRVVRQDITGTTDGNGNATINVKLPFTGAWYDVKFPLGLPSSAEWAILLSGTPVTYGRGRRVTLGPELIQDGEQVTISVTGGPPNAAILGSMNGKAGSPDEILAGYTMSPNTIALDVGSPQIVLGTVSVLNAGTNAANFVLPIGTQSLALIPGTPFQQPHQASVVGHQSGTTYLQATAPGSGTSLTSTPLYTPVLSAEDTSVDVQIVGVAAQNNFVTVVANLAPSVTSVNIASVGFRPLGQGSSGQDTGSAALNSIPVVPALTYRPTLWQAPTAAIETASGNAGGTPLLAGIAGLVVRVFGCGVDIEGAAGNRLVALQSSVTATRFCYLFSANGSENAFLGGHPLPAGEGVNIVTSTLAGELYRAYIGYSQG